MPMRAACYDAPCRAWHGTRADRCLRVITPMICADMTCRCHFASADAFAAADAYFLLILRQFIMREYMLMLYATPIL